MRWIVVALVLAGCGAEAKPAATPTPQNEVERTLTQVHAAVLSGSSDRVCAFYATANKREMQSAYGQTCEQTLGAALQDLPVELLPKKPDIGRVEIKGKRATVTEAGSEEDPDQVELVREGNAWKLDLDAPPEALEAPPECVETTGSAYKELPGAREVPPGTLDEVVDRLCSRGSRIGILPLLGSLSDTDAKLIGISVVNDLKRDGVLTQEQAMALLR